MKNAPQIIMIALYAFAIISDAVRDGEPKKGTHKFAITFVASLVGIALLWWGGFWEPLFL